MSKLKAEKDTIHNFSHVKKLRKNPGNRPKRHTGRDEVEIRYPVKVHYSQTFLDPGSHPALRDLAGMTNCDAASQGKKSFAELST